MGLRTLGAHVGFLVMLVRHESGGFEKGFLMLCCSLLIVAPEMGKYSQ